MHGAACIPKQKHPERERSYVRNRISSQPSAGIVEEHLNSPSSIWDQVTSKKDGEMKFC